MTSPKSIGCCPADETFTMLQVSRVEPQIGPLAGQRPVEKGMHALVDLPRLRGGRLLHSLETCDLLIPDSPIACTRSSTRRVSISCGLKKARPMRRRM